MEGLQKLSRIRFAPAQDTAFAVFSLLLFWGATFVGYRVQFASERLTNFVWLVIFFVLGQGFLALFFPVAYTTQERLETLKDIHLRRDHLPLALGLGLVIGIGLWVGLIGPGFNLGMLPNLGYALLTFGEAFFVFGWLLSRYERAFGGIPAALLTGASFVLYHLFVLDTATLLPLGIMVALLSVFVIITGSVLTAWPFGWLALSLVMAGSLDYEIGWGLLIGFGLLLALQVTAINWLEIEAKLLRKRKVFLPD